MRTFEQVTTEQLIRTIQGLMTDSTDTTNYLKSLTRDELRTLICQLV